MSTYPKPEAVIFDLGGTLVHWPDWDEAAPVRWAEALDCVCRSSPGLLIVPKEEFVAAMRDAELAHWRRVENEHWSGPPSTLIQDGFHRLGTRASEEQLVAVLDGYANAVDGWAKVFPDSRETLNWLRENGFRTALLSNTWWAADWHNADLATHGLFPFLDEIVYTSDLPHSKPHPYVFEHVASLLETRPEACVMVGDRPVDDIGGALGVGMRAVWKTGGVVAELPDHIEPTAVIDRLGRLPNLMARWSNGT